MPSNAGQALATHYMPTWHDVKGDDSQEHKHVDEAGIHALVFCDGAVEGVAHIVDAKGRQLQIRGEEGCGVKVMNEGWGAFAGVGTLVVLML